MSSNNIAFSNSSNNINQLNPNNSLNNNNNNNLAIPNIVPQRGGQLLVPNQQAQNNSVSFSNPILSNHINNLNQRFSNNSNMFYRYFNSNHSNIMNNQEENIIAESYEVSPMEIDGQVIYKKLNFLIKLFINKNCGSSSDNFFISSRKSEIIFLINFSTSLYNSSHL